MKEIYEIVRDLREDHDELQQEVADYLGITKQQYSLYETGKRQFKLEHIKKLCVRYNVSADYILGISIPSKADKTEK